MPLLVYNFFFSLGSLARLYGDSPQGSGPVVLYNVQCSGIERRLLECPNTALDVNNCRHSEDAGVTCSPGMFFSSSSLTDIRSRDK